MPETTTRVLPQDHAAEAAVLGSMIVDPRCIGEVVKLLDRDAFFRDEHQLLFACITDMAKNGDGIDGLLVRADLERRGQLAAVGEANYIQKLLDTVPSSANVAYYARIVRDCSIRRKAIVSAQRVLDGAHDLQTDIGRQIADAQADLSAIGVTTNGNELGSRCMADVLPEKVAWFLNDVYPNGCFSLLDGDGGVGKSYLLHALAASISTGRPFGGLPNLPTKQGSVLIFAAEDSPPIVSDRLDTLKADRRNVHIVDDTFDIHYGVPEIERFADEHPDLRLIIFDPISSYAGAINQNNTPEVREALKPVTKLALDRHIAIVGILHLNKRQDLSSIYRTAGSGAWIQVARAAWRVALDKDDDDDHIFAPVKFNYGKKPTGKKFRIVDGIVTFLAEPWLGSLDDMAKPRDGKLRVDDCSEWLKDRLAAGAVLSDTIFTEAAEQGFGRNLCFRAKHRLSIKAVKVNFEDKRWWWTHPGNGEAE